MAGWSPEVDHLLGQFEVLRGLLVTEPLSPGSELMRLLLSVGPQQLGLPSGCAASGDWSLFCGGLLYAANALDEAHRIFQDARSAEGSYWHGMLHRREGDFPNAQYWVQSAGRISCLTELGAFSPSIFISECAAAAGRGEEPERLLASQRREWEVLMLWSWKRMSRAGGDS